MAKVKQIVKMPENMVRVVAEGKFRAELDEVISVSPYLLTDVIIHDREEKVENENEAEAMRRVLEEILKKFIDAGAKFGPEITRQMEQAEDIVKTDESALCQHADALAGQTDTGGEGGFS